MSQATEKDAHEALTQGSILLGIDWGIDVSPPGIVLTNPCDLENDKASFLLVAACKPAKEVFQLSKEFRDFAAAQSPSSRHRESIARSAEAVILNRSIGRYFAFDATELHEDETWLVVDFQHLLCLDYDQGAVPGELVGQLESPYCQQMLHSFASYVARVGVNRPAPETQARAVSSMLQH